MKFSHKKGLKIKHVGTIADIESGFSTINITLLSDKAVVKLH